MEEQSKYGEKNDHHEHASESMSPESVDSSQGARASRQPPPSPAESPDRGENFWHPAFFLSDEHIRRICSDAVNLAYDKAELSVLEDRDLGFFGDVTTSPPRLSRPGSVTAGEETSGSPVSGRSASSPCGTALSVRGRRSSSSRSSQTSSGSRRAREARQRINLALDEIVAAGSDGTPAGSIDLTEASPSPASSSSSSSRRSTPTAHMVAINIVAFLLDDTKLSLEAEKADIRSFVDSLEESVECLLTLDALVPVVVDERVHDPTASHTDLIPGVNMDPGCSSDISEEVVTDELVVTEANAPTSSPSSSRGGSSPCPMRAFLASKDLKGFLHGANVRGFSEQLISHSAQILLGCREAKTTLVRGCSSDTAVDSMGGRVESTADQFHTELIHSFVEGAVKNLLETFLSLPHSPPAETYMEDYSFMEEKNWVASPNSSSCDSRPCEEAEINDEESLTEMNVEESLTEMNVEESLTEMNVEESLTDTYKSSSSAALEVIPILTASMTDVSSYVTTTTFSSSSTMSTSSATTPETQTRAESTEAGCCHIFCRRPRQRKDVGPTVKELKIFLQNSVAPMPADAPAAQKSKEPGYVRFLSAFAAVACQAFCFRCCTKEV